MTTSTFVERRRRLARRALLSLSTILATGCLLPAQAQITAPAPVQQTVDANGVDLFLGTFNINRKDLLIGDGDLGVAYKRSWRGSSWSDNYDMHVTLAGNRFTVTIGDFSEDFIAQGNLLYNAQGSGSIFYFSGSTYYYQAADGTFYTFDSANAYNTISNGDVARVSSIDKRNFDETLFRYNQYSVCVASNGSCSTRKTVRRLASVIRNQAFTTELSYATDTADDPSQLSDFYRVTSATVRNYAVDCDVTLPSCKNSLTATYGSDSATDPEGRTDHYNMSGSQIIGIQHAGSDLADTTISYDGSGKVQSVATSGTSTTYGYADDASANERTTTITDALNHSRYAVFDLTSHLMKRSTDENGNTTTFIRDDRGRPIKVISPEGNENAGYTGYSYDSTGNVLQLVQVPKDGSTSITTSATFACQNTILGYPDCSRPSTSTDANGGVTNYGYDTRTGALTSITLPAPSTGAARPQTRFIYQYLQPRVKNTSNSLIYGSQTQLLTGVSICRTGSSCTGTADETVTSFGRGTASDNSSPGANTLAVVSITTSAGDGSASSSTGRTHDNIGNVIASIDAVGATTNYAYDNDRELLSTTSADPDGAGPMKARQIANHYNSRGLVDSVAVGTVDAAGIFTAGQYRTSIYDTAGRKIADQASDGNVDYSLVQYGFDGAGRLECVAQRMNPATFSSLSTPACSLGMAGVDGPDRITKTSFDPAGQVTAVTSAYGTEAPTVDTAFTYTPNGKVTSVTDANGNVTSYGYDGFDRALRICYQTTGPCMASAPDREEVIYDGGGAGIGTVTSRRLRDGQVLSYDYDILGRRTYDHNPNTSIAEKDVSYGYDLLGRMLTASDGNGWSNSVTYDALGRGVTQASNVSSTGLQYDAAGRLVRQTWADAFYVTYDYDNLGEMTAIHENGGFTLASFTYDDLGRRTSLTRGNGAVTNYSYDGAGRLQTLSSGGNTPNSYGFGYNVAGQITSRSSGNDAYAWTGAQNANSSYAVNGLNQYTKVGDTTFGYDGRGNLTTTGSDSYQYNTRNQLFMNAAGQLIYRGPSGLLGQTPGTNFDWVNGQLAQESSDHVLRRYVYGPGTDEPLVWYEGSGTGDKRYLVADERGSIVGVTDANGNQIATNTFDEHGGPGPSNQGRFGYTGQIWIPELKMWDYKARMYSPTLGRFMQTDPIGYADGMNAYAYVGNDPVNATDPTGLYDCNNRSAYDLPCVQMSSSGSGGTSTSQSPSIPVLSTIANFLNNIFSGNSRIAAPLQQPAPKLDRPQVPLKSCSIQSGPAVGLWTGGSAEAGILSFGGAAQRGYSVMSLPNHQFAAYRTTGAAIGGPGYGSAPNGSTVLGGAIGWGGGVSFSNAKTPSDLTGSSDTWNTNLLVFSLSLSLGNNGIVSGNAGLAKGVGLDVSNYPTETTLLSSSEPYCPRG